MKKTYHIEGMHCKACELLVKKGCEELCDCDIMNVDHRSGTAVLERTGKEDEHALKNILHKCGYELSDGTQTKKRNLDTQMQWILLLVALVLTFVLIKVDVLAFVSTMQSEASLPVVLLLGLVASVSTCLAVTGGVIIGFTEMIEEGKGWSAHAKLHASFQGGRLLGFFIFGALLGRLGQTISISLGFSSWLNAGIALVFVYLGLQLLGLVPSLSSLGVHLPEKWTTRILSQKNPLVAPVVGSLTFFLPCGFTQSVQLMALASGGFMTGGLLMFTFALGTLPGLLALGMGTSFAKDNRKQGFETIVAVVLLVFGFFTFWGSASIRGLTDRLAMQQGTPQGNTQVVEDTDTTGITRISLGHNGTQVVPETTILKAGQDYEITISPESDGLGCMNTITLPRIDSIAKRVIKGETITYLIEDAQPGQYSFVCASMGMSQGKIIIE